MTANTDEVTRYQYDILLALVKCGNATGQDLRRAIQDQTDDDSTDGRLYKHLDRLEERGLVIKDEGNYANSYRLTVNGYEHVEDRLAWYLNATQEGHEIEHYSDGDIKLNPD